MASIVEFHDIQLPNHQSNYALTPIPEMQILEELMSQDTEPLPTPPLSPEHDSICSSPAMMSSCSSSQTPDLDSTDTIEAGEAILNSMIQLFGEDEELLAFSDSQTNVFSLEGSFIMQDCMWNSFAYKPRNSIASVSSEGVYTPAPSPPPSAQEDEDEEEKGEGSTSPTPNETDSSHSSDQTECVSPNDVLPTHLIMQEKEIVRRPRTFPSRKDKLCKTVERRSVSTRGNSRIHPQATSSESEEEIDVVTVYERPVRPASSRVNSRKRPISAPCSRQGSPTPSSCTKRRRTHSKRLPRRSMTNEGDYITESDDEQRRASHNILERKRRNDLKYSFQLLREQIPELEENQRAPKVIILRKAAEFIKYIREREDKLENEFQQEKKREAKLRQRLAYLKTVMVAS